ncbi:hypothetical protein B0H14DRAFT_3012642 [Mycena olivaceomarginata]|nr:hypothetical protein B0H14DRAFT_3012642 [Mycena olivaceomarginata]
MHRILCRRLLAILAGYIGVGALALPPGSSSITAPDVSSTGNPVGTAIVSPPAPLLATELPAISGSVNQELSPEFVPDCPCCPFSPLNTGGVGLEMVGRMLEGSLSKSALTERTC